MNFALISLFGHWQQTKRSNIPNFVLQVQKRTTQNELIFKHGEHIYIKDVSVFLIDY